ncbi:DNA mismatch repair endonuclease MutL [Chlorobium phaeovibrioides]|uniref:DNA mismatch repair protein MutL n=1 Tax=Chlorobium phaeovibrioides TaxID=1094 RepID=A0ABW9UNR0_CHLPH|nr:DNA mismatch repair endonuclease MutL [Chlorobium phaeovibrioides]MWV53835.1 DNA mismatch repair endonuclease MutL [Chlorobium phaeovibrioides]QEQ56408.1 DNA mismatch repair endonuclease MutL [Chlorobium phaeovibrioides]RTY36572.1 DNA mismatch repair endonuclease MutL [Chlorobium phaeovibrioides]
MAGIARLPESVANKISAGEVVQRPVSVVKELLENAIDAGADRISVIISDAGKELVRIVDNGSGMERDDALLSVERFATSKIRGVEDLEDLSSLGFRGEALASISSVSHFELRTAVEGSSLALSFRYEGGVLVEEAQVQGERGTSISVRNLFYNVPARRKFLKSNATEYGHIYELVRSFVLACPEISWQMVNDGEELFNFRTPDLNERLDFFYGSGFAESLVPVTEENDYISIRGFIGRPALQKRRRLDQYFFINRRLVQNRMLSQALQQAYGELLVERQAPFALLFFEMDPSRIDVNVHPAKLEVRFEDERSVRNMFYPVIKRAVRSYDFSPDLASGELPPLSTRYPSPSPIAFQDVAEPAVTKGELYRNYREGAFSTSRPPANLPEGFQEQLFSPPEPPAGFVGTASLAGSGGNEDEVPLGDAVAEVKIWQLHNKYLICQIKTGLMIIDQHVAHERVLYERAVDVMETSVPNSQQLLFPQKVELRPWDWEIFEEIRDDLYRLGFNLSLFGSRTVMIEGVPQDVRPGSEVSILQDMIAEYSENASKLKLEKRDNLAKSYSCRNAIMTGQKLSLQEMRSLIDSLFATRDPYCCPHGRPVIIKMTLGQLDHMFGRK